jgi:hypothetical protein
MYYAQYDVLEDLSKGKKWSFVEVRPDGVVSHNSLAYHFHLAHI